MHRCPACASPRLSLVDAQSLDGQRCWILEAYCPDCRQTFGGEVTLAQLGALADAVEEAYAEMLQAVASGAAWPR